MPRVEEIVAAKNRVQKKRKNGTNCNLHEGCDYMVQFARAFKVLNWEFACGAHGIGFAKIYI